MIGSKYVDSSSCIQLIGCVMKQPSLLNDEGKYFFTEHDFINDFHKVVFGSIYNLHTMGAQNVSVKAIEDYLANRPESLGIYRAGKGAEWISKAIESADLANFDYYYTRVKKMTLLREYDKCGVDVRWIYDPDNILDISKKQKQENYLDSLSLQQIADIITERIENICRTYVDNSTDEANAVGDNIFQLLEDLEKTPEVGPPMYGTLINTVTRGMREKKLYMRSAPTGVGKTRTMIADATYNACSEMYNSRTRKWEPIPSMSLPTLYISTELELVEVQTMCLAFLSDVNEENILTNTYGIGEKERVIHAAEILSKAPLYIEVVPDFSLKDIENIIKRNIRTRRCKYVFN